MVKRKQRFKGKKRLSLRVFSLNVAICLLLLINLALIFSLLYKFFRSPSVETVKITESPLEEEKIIQVEVLNGCGVTRLARRFADYLRKLDFDVVNIGNYKSYDVDKTIVIDRRSMDMRYALKVAQALGVQDNSVLAILNKDLYLDVSVIIGKDYKKLKGYR